MEAGDQERIEGKLDLLIAIQRAAHAEALARLRDSVASDVVAKAVLMATKEWIAAGELKRRARSASSASQPTVERRIADLVDHGILVPRGAGGNVQYRSSRLIEP